MIKSFRIIALAVTFVSSTTLIAANSAQQTTLGSGLQTIKNSSNKTVVIALGDFFPTSYTLAPGETKIVSVSTDRQHINIVSVR